MENNKPETRLTLNRPYKYDRAMIEAIKRIGAQYPRMISMVSTVPDFNKAGSNK